MYTNIRLKFLNILFSILFLLDNQALKEMPFVKYLRHFFNDLPDDTAIARQCRCLYAQENNLIANFIGAYEVK